MKKNKHHDAPQPDNEAGADDTQTNPETAETSAGAQPETEAATATGADAELADMKDKYLRLYSEFDNFRRRTAKEKLETVKTANQDLMLSLLPVLDDLERAHKAIETATDLESVKHGVDLVFQKLYNTLSANGLSAIDSVGQEFDTDKHEANTQIPAPSPELKGKIVDQVEKGYSLYDKVIRFAKVVLGA